MVDQADDTGGAPATGVTTGAEAGWSDAEVIAASHGEPERFAIVYDRHAAALYRYAARRLGPDVAQDVVITEPDCGTEAGLTMTPIVEGGDVVEPLPSRMRAAGGWAGAGVARPRAAA